MPAWAAVRVGAGVPAEGDYDWYVAVGMQRRPGESLADFERRTGVRSRVSLENLVGSRKGWRRVGDAWLIQEGRPDAFAFREDEQWGPMEVLEEIARVYGGEHLLAWTVGGSVQAMRWPGGRREAWRVKPYPSRASRGDLDVPAWFASLGVEGVLAVDPARVWRDFEEAAGALLEGRAASVKGVNAWLPADRALKKGASPRRVAEAAAALERSVGPGPARLGAADLAGRIADLGDLTGGTGPGYAASFGRLLAHYPASRDGLFFALAGLRTEAANGHPWVPAWFALAGSAATAGATLAVFPADRLAEFRRAFGLRPPEEEPACGAWAGEAFVDLPDRPSPWEALEAWFAGGEGLLARAEPSGRMRVRRFPSGEEEVRESPAAAALDLEGMFSEIGHPGVLGLREIPPEAPRAAPPRAAKLLEGAPAPAPSQGLEPLYGLFLDSGLPFQEMARRREPTLACRLEFPLEEDAEALLTDAQRLVPSAWREGRSVWLAGHALPLSLVAGVAGDVPAGTRVAFNRPGGGVAHFQVS